MLIKLFLALKVRDNYINIGVGRMQLHALLK